MLCAERLATAPFQPSPLRNRTSRRLGVLRRLVPRPFPRARPSLHARSGRWQLEQDTLPEGDRPASKNSRRPNETACGRLAIGFDELPSQGIGQGPCARMARVSAAESAWAAANGAHQTVVRTASAADAMEPARRLDRPADVSGANILERYPGAAALSRTARQQDGISRIVPPRRADGPVLGGPCRLHDTRLTEEVGAKLGSMMPWIEQKRELTSRGS